jgi:hypothetical protein
MAAVMKTHLALCLLLICVASVPIRAADLSIAHQYSAGAVKLVLGSTVADICIDAKDARVTHIAADLLGLRPPEIVL